ncbi:MAG: DUF2339 domain-containing protein, partial [Candidatus Hydrogenedentes bacterium]|nr:DUF2339 domain-containing protein [Candidatus Hydrogenedentota bacterium]
GVISQGFTGLAIAVFYVCVYFSFQIYELTGQSVSFILASGVTALAITLAVLQDAPSIAVLAVIGGFLSPVFISTGENRPYALFGYLVLLDLVAVGVAWFKRWRFLDALCFIGTALLYLGWYFLFFGDPDEPDMTLPAAVYASIFYVLFLASASLHSLVRQTKSRPEDLVVASLNAAFWFFAYYNVLYADHRYLLGGVVLGQASLAFLVFLVWRKRVEEDRTAHAVLLVIAMGLSVLAVPILLKLYVYQIAWAVQGAVFVYLGYRYRYDLALGGGVVAWTLGAGALFRTLPLHTEKFIPVFNEPFGSWVCVIAAGAVIALILNRFPEEGRPWKVPVIGFMGLAGLGLACLLLTFETALFWTTRGYENYDVYQHSSLAVLWAIVPFVVMAFLCQKRLFNWLLVAIVVYCIAVVFWLVGLAHYELAEPWMFLNTSFLARVLLVGSLAAGAALVFRTRGEPDKNALLRVTSGQITNMLVLVSYLMGAYLLTLEVWTFWELREYVHGAVYQAGSLTALWAVISFATAYVICRKRFEYWIPLAVSAYAFAVILFLGLLTRYRMPDTYLFWNVSFGLRVPIAASLAAGAWYMHRVPMQARLFGGPPFAISKIAAGCAIAGHLVFAVLAAFELWYWSKRTELVSEKMALSFISSAWGLQAFLLIVIGMFLRSRTQRLLGLAFFAVTIGKVWLVDLVSVEPLYRILSFIAVGLLLLPASILYQRFSDMVLKESDNAAGEVENPQKDPGEESDS